MNFYILTLFPEMVMNGLMTSITGRAIQQNKIGVEAVDIRDYTEEKHGRVDDYTYGGGAGMLMQAQPVYDAFVSVRDRIPKTHKKRVIYVTPQGRPFTQQTAEELAQNDDLVLLCGHYEGVDERVLEEIVTDYISIGDYVLTGGELAAMVIVDAVARLVPSVLHNESSAQTESFRGDLLEYPQYSRPEEWHGRRVPSVLLSGNQKEIESWRRKESEARTAERRPDMYARYLALQECEKRLLLDKLHHMDMIGLIRRGRAILVERSDLGILLEDRETHVLYHTKNDKNAGNNAIIDKNAGKYARIALHQADCIPMFERLGYRFERECRQYVCTRREQLPISGLYGADGRNFQTGLDIRPLAPEQLLAVQELLCACVSWNQTEGACLSIPEEWGRAEDRESLRRLSCRMEKGLVCGAFLDGTLAGVIGAREDGCVELLAVLPQYRRRKIATALETYLFNQQLRQGMTPYSQAEGMNKAFHALQERLGIYVAKESVYWMKK